MLFSSITFLYYFLPIVLLVYMLVPRKGKNIVLFLSSLIFYGWGEPKYIFLMLLSIIVNYILGLLIEKHQDTKLAKGWLILSVLFSLILLGFFKYSNFLIDNFNFVTGYSLQLLRITLPVGISFYTFQILSYTIDVYRKHTTAQKNIINLATYVVLFPQLIAGPIVRYVDVAAALEKRNHDIESLRCGLRRFIFGLTKKVLIANSLGELCNIFISTQEKSVLFYWLYAISFSLQIYFDFSGYSDMAIGLGRIFGFEFIENFNYPYISKNITEFWRRWHMSLGTWFRDYLYIPLGGNRVKKSRWLFNILLVWIFTGFWHGASWNFIFWGLLYAFMLIIEKLWLNKLLLKLPNWISHIYVIIVVMIGFVIFDAPNMSEAINRIIIMFGFGSTAISNTQSLYYLRSYGVILIIAVIGCTPFPKTCMTNISRRLYIHKIFTVLEPLICIVLLLITTAYLVDASFNPFLYFRF